jgi:hypothetical protein
MSFLSGIGDAISDAADAVGDVVSGAVGVAGDVVDVAAGVVERMADGAIDSVKHSFDDVWSGVKTIAFATVLAPVSLVVTAYNLGDAIYQETDEKLKENKSK